MTTLVGGGQHVLNIFVLQTGKFSHNSIQCNENVKNLRNCRVKCVKGRVKCVKGRVIGTLLALGGKM